MKQLLSVLKYIGKKAIVLIPVFLVALFINFLLLKELPGDPVSIYLGPERFASLQPGEYEQYAEFLGLNDTVITQYWLWLKRFFTGDLGVSLKANLEVWEYLKTPLKNTFVLNAISFAIAFVIAIFIGVMQALHRDKVRDKVASVGTLVGVSVPSFVIALTLILIFAVELKWLPMQGMYNPEATGPMWIDKLKHMILPVTAIVISSLATISRYTRTSMSNAMSKDYIRTARAKGVPRRKVVWKHGFRNALLPLITLMGAFLPGLFAGSIVLETVFNWNGIGRILVESITQRDVSVTMAITTLFVFVTLVSYILVDIAYAIADPRVRR